MAGLHLSFSALLSDCLNIVLSERNPISPMPVLFESISIDSTNSNNYFRVRF